MTAPPHKLVELGVDECLALLAGGALGRVAYIEDAEPRRSATPRNSPSCEHWA